MHGYKWPMNEFLPTHPYYSDFVANRTHMWLRQRLATSGAVIDEMVLER